MIQSETENVCRPRKPSKFAAYRDAVRRDDTAAIGFQDRCLKRLGHPSRLRKSEICAPSLGEQTRNIGGFATGLPLLAIEVGPQYPVDPVRGIFLMPGMRWL